MSLPKKRIRGRFDRLEGGMAVDLSMGISIGMSIGMVDMMIGSWSVVSEGCIYT